MDKGIFIKDLDIGEYHVISLDDKGKVYCWGSNSDGQCGIDATDRVNRKVVYPNKIEYGLEDFEVILKSEQVHIIQVV